jgi:hypothetical protein
MKSIGSKLNSEATRGEGTQNTLCAYLSVAILIGLAANAVFDYWWADPIVALAVAIAPSKPGRRHGAVNPAQQAAKTRSRPALAPARIRPPLYRGVAA